MGGTRGNTGRTCKLHTERPGNKPRHVARCGTTKPSCCAATVLRTVPPCPQLGSCYIPCMVPHSVLGLSLTTSCTSFQLGSFPSNYFCSSLAAASGSSSLWHGGSACSTIASQQEGCGFKSRMVQHVGACSRAFLCGVCMFSLCSPGFSP